MVVSNNIAPNINYSFAKITASVDVESGTLARSQSIYVSDNIGFEMGSTTLDT